jgi:hypothetical protein
MTFKCETEGCNNIISIEKENYESSIFYICQSCWEDSHNPYSKYNELD